ncbi:MAG: hypothetical protein ABEH88_12305 [Halobacteriales archaeon]
MLARNLRRLGYLFMIGYGVLDAVVPRTFLRLKLAPAGLVFENVGEIKATEGYVRGARAAGLGLVVAGATGLALESTGGGGSRTGDDGEDASGE